MCKLTFSLRVNDLIKQETGSKYLWCALAMAITLSEVKKTIPRLWLDIDFLNLTLS